MSLTPFSFASADDLCDLGGDGRRYTWNVRALHLLQTLEEEGREPDVDEQLTLAHYTAFGATINRAVRVSRTTGKHEPIEDVKDLLTMPEAAAIARGSLTQYFTPLFMSQMLGVVVERVLQDVTTPKILEPAAGIGMLIAAMPTSLRVRSAIDAVELDKISSRIFAHLHPDVRLYGATGFEDVEMLDDTYDLAVCNVPFSGVRVTDSMFPRSERELCATLHDFFIAKMMKVVRPGGYVIVLTSYGTMDKKTSVMRKWLTTQGNLVGALRLPNGIFMENSGSHSGCDLLIFQKYGPNEEQNLNPPWLMSQRCGIPIGEHTINAVTSQSMDYGTETMLGQPFTPGSPDVLGTYIAFEGKDTQGEKKIFYVLQAWNTTPVASQISQKLMQMYLRPVAARDDIPDHYRSDILVDVKPVALEQIDMVPIKHHARMEQAKAVFLAARTLISYEVNGEDDEEVESWRERLNDTYDAFSSLYGAFHTPDNMKILAPIILEYPLLLALERDPTMSRAGIVVGKSAIFYQRRTTRRTPCELGTYSVEDALTWCLSERVVIDIPYIATLCGMRDEEVIAALKGRIYRVLDVRTRQYILKEELCSGNVRATLEKARRMARAHPDDFADHVAVLEEALPAPLVRAQIRLTLGNAIVGPDIVTLFIASIVPEFSNSTTKGRVEFHEAVNSWKIHIPETARKSPQSRVEWGTARRTFFEIFDAVIHQRELVVRDTFVREDGTEYTKINPKDTLEANEMARRIKAKFERWLWEDDARSGDLERRYNEERNSHVERRFDGAHLHLVGLNTEGLRKDDADAHQKDMIWRILCSQTNYIAHPVGSGKTLMMVAGIAESIRRGMAHKALVVVPNSIVGQWATDMIRFYPNLRVLSMTSKDFTKNRRLRFMATVATQSWDVVVVGTSTHTRLPLPRAIRREFYSEEIDALRAYLMGLADKDDRPAKERKRDRGLKKVESRIERLEARLKDIDAGIERDDERIINLVDLGFDMLIVDEFHLFKNLEFSTAKTGIAGLPNGGSERAFDMWQKIRYFQSKGHKVVVASATPIANTIAEAFVNQKYLQWNVIREQGLSQFDQWAAQFAEPIQSFEMRPDASGFRIVTRMSKFINLPELHQLTRQVMDVRLEEQLQLPRPKIITGRPVPIIIPASQQLRDFIVDLGVRADAIKNGDVTPEEDNMLLISSHGRLAALDMRLVGGSRDPGNKIDVLVDNILTRYTESALWNGVQAVFCDLGTPKGT